MAKISPLPSIFLDNGFKSSASMWFSLDSNSTWGPSIVSAPSANSSFFSIDNSKSDPDWQNQSALKKAVAKPKTVKSPIMPEALPKKSPADEFVQVSSNQRWSAQPIGFPQVQNQPYVVEKKPLPASPTKSQQIPSVQSATSQPIDNISSSNSTTQKSSANGEEDMAPQSLYKTELCRSFEETGSCRYGLKCQFAHGRAELRPVVRHPKYKTEVCKTFHTIGTCPYGKRCRFIHIEQGMAVNNVPNQQQTPPAIIPTPVQPKPIAEDYSNVIPQNISSGWSSGWSDPTPVNVFSPVGKSLDASPPKPAMLIENLPVMKTSNDIQRRSRLVIFQQICS